MYLFLFKVQTNSHTTKTTTCVDPRNLLSIRVTMGKNDKNTFFAITSKVDFGLTSFFLENWSVFHAEFEYDTHDECNRK